MTDAIKRTPRTTPKTAMPEGRAASSTTPSSPAHVGAPRAKVPVATPDAFVSSERTATTSEARAPKLVAGLPVDAVKAATGAGSAIAEAFGIKLPALDEVKLSDLARGNLELRIALVDDRTYEVPMGDSPPLELRVPRAPFGIELVVEVDLDTVVHEGVAEPALSNVRVYFEASGMLPTGERAPVDQVPFPLILNPSALKPAEGFMSGVKNVATDLAADIRLGGLSIDRDGHIKLGGDVVVAGFDHQDFHELAKPSLPRVETRLARIAEGQLLAPTSSTSPSSADVADAPAKATAGGPTLHIKDLIETFAAVASSGTWSAELETRAAPKRPSTALFSHGALTISHDLELEGDFRVDAYVEDRAVNVVVEGAADLKRARGALRAEVGADGAKVGHGVSWTREGLTIDGVDVDALLPLDLRVPPRDVRAPRVGTPAFREHIAALLGDENRAHVGNEITFLRDGDAVLRERLALISRAGPGSTVLLQTFIFKDDVSGNALVDALIAAKERGADVRVLLDTVGTIGPNRDQIVPGPIVYQRLRAAGVDVALVNDPRASITSLVTETAALLASDPTLATKLEERGAPLLARFVSALAEVSDLEELVAEPTKLLTLAALGAKAKAELPLVVGLDVSDDTKARLVALVETRAPDLLKDLARDHRKQLVVYGPSPEGPNAEVIAGGNNVGDDYLMEAHSSGYEPDARHKGMPLWNDVDLRVRGTSLVASTSKAFAETWAHATGNALDLAEVPHVSTTAKGESLRVVHHQPIGPSRTGEGDNHLTNVMLATLAGLGAGDRVSIANPYFLPIPELRDAMIDAARRGAKITIVTNGPYENNDTPIVSQLSRRFVLRDLVAEDGIEVYETKATEQPIHKKTMAVETRDGKTLSVVGSENLDGLSMRVNNEMFFLGGTALDERSDARDSVARELFADMRRDTGRDVAHLVTTRDFAHDDASAIVGDYLKSLLLPVV